MSCYTPEKWVDFVRGTMLPEQTADVERHLHSGCPRCSKASSLWRSLADFAKRQVFYEPPESVVRVVKESFSHALAPKASPGFTLVASLVFDSLRQPRPEGVRRSRRPVPQQLLYAAGDYLVDLRVEGASKRVILVGQVLRSSKPGEPIPSIPVTLQLGSEPLAKSTSNPFGEFQFEFDFQAGKNFQLAIGLDAESSIVLSLRDLKPPSRRVAGAWPRASRPTIMPGRNPFQNN